MRKLAVIVVALVVVGWGVAAIVTGSAGLGLESATAAAAPACLPATPVASAEVAGMSVSPAPGSVVANPHTTISLLGATPGQISALSVEGSQQRPPRRAAGWPTRRATARASCPTPRSRPGEHVTVRAQITKLPARQLSFSFRIDTPFATTDDRVLPQPRRRRGGRAELLHAARRAAAGADRDDARPRPGGG